MLNFETDPGTGVLFIGFVTFLILGFVTLTGTWALVLWIAIALIGFFLLYAVGIRLAKWARGEHQFRAPERE